MMYAPVYHRDHIPPAKIRLPWWAYLIFDSAVVAIVAPISYYWIAPAVFNAIR